MFNLGKIILAFAYVILTCGGVVVFVGCGGGGGVGGGGGDINTL